MINHKFWIKNTHNRQQDMIPYLACKYISLLYTITHSAFVLIIYIYVDVCRLYILL